MCEIDFVIVDFIGIDFVGVDLVGMNHKFGATRKHRNVGIDMGMGTKMNS